MKKTSQVQKLHLQKFNYTNNMDCSSSNYRKKIRFLSSSVLRQLSEESPNLGPENCELISLKHRSSIKGGPVFASAFKMYENLSDEEEVMVSSAVSSGDQERTLTKKKKPSVQRRGSCSRVSPKVPDVVLIPAPDEEKRYLYDNGSRRSSRSNSTLTLQLPTPASQAVSKGGRNSPKRVETVYKIDSSLRINTTNIDSSSKLEHWPTDSLAKGAKNKQGRDVTEIDDYDAKIKKLHRRKSTSPSAANDGQKRSRSCFPQSSPSFSFTTENNNNDSIPNGSKKNDVIKETVMRSSTPVLQKVHPKKSTSSGKGGTEKDGASRNSKKRSSAVKTRRSASTNVDNRLNNKTNQTVIQGTLAVRDPARNSSTPQKFFFLLCTNQLLIAKQKNSKKEEKYSDERKISVCDLWCWESSLDDNDVTSGKFDHPLELHLGWPMKTITIVFEKPHEKSLWKASFDSCIVSANNVQSTSSSLEEMKSVPPLAVKFGDRTRDFSLTNHNTTANDVIQQSSLLFEGSGVRIQPSTHILTCFYGKKLCSKFQLSGHEKIYSLVKHAMNEYNLLSLQGLCDKDDVTSRKENSSQKAKSSSSSSSVFNNHQPVIMFCITDKNERPSSHSDSSIRSRGDSQTSPNNGKGHGNFIINGISKVTAKGSRIRGRSLDRGVESKGGGGSSKLNSWMKSRDKSSTGNHSSRSCRKGNDDSLFGVPLEKLCGQINQCNESAVRLPGPILGLLYHLYSRGILQEGVFRKASRRAEKNEHIGKLNRGEDVNLEEMAPILMADLLKEFLRLLPSCVLISEDYDTWTKLLEEKNQELRIQNISKVLFLLPKHNFDLSVRLFFILYSVIKCQPEISPTAMSTCIAPSVLFPTHQTPLSVGSAEANQIVAELIGSYEKIVGPKMFSHIEQEFMERAREFETKNRNDVSFTSSTSPTSHDSGIGIGQSSLSSLDFQSYRNGPMTSSYQNGTIKNSTSSKADKKKWLHLDDEENPAKIMAPVSASTPISPKVVPRIIKSHQGGTNPGSISNRSLDSRLSYTRSDTPNSDDSSQHGGDGRLSGGVRKTSWNLLTQQLDSSMSSYSFGQDCSSGGTSSRSSTPLAGCSRLQNGHRPRIQTLPSKPTFPSDPSCMTSPSRKTPFPTHHHDQSIKTRDVATSSPEVNTNVHPSPDYHSSRQENELNYKFSKSRSSPKNQSALSSSIDSWNLGSKC